MTKEQLANSNTEPHMICDEGGIHKFQLKKEPSCGHWCLCICCFPCYALCSCLLSEGAALANPVFEQMCCKSKSPPDELGQSTCSKCGLTEREAIDLSDARNIEASQGNRNTGYFSNAMTMPSPANNSTSPTSDTRPT